MLRHDPHVRGGIMRFQNCCVNVSMNWKEGGKDLVAPLSRHMRRHFNDFLRQAVESCLYAGFVPFIVTRIDNIPTPVCLPIGSYSWATEIRPCKRKRKEGGEGGGESGEATVAGARHRVHPALLAAGLHLDALLRRHDPHRGSRSPETTRDHPRLPEITRDHPRLTRYHPRLPEITRDYPRLPEITRD